jgi:coatomer subunit zeta
MAPQRMVRRSQPFFFFAHACAIIFIWERTGDIILYDGHLAVYRHSLDLLFYMLGEPLENELMLHSALSAFMDALHVLLRNQVEKRAVLENLDCVILCLDETIDDG